MTGYPPRRANGAAPNTEEAESREAMGYLISVRKVRWFERSVAGVVE